MPQHPDPRLASIALCTCNGERYLAEQLWSALNQTHTNPDNLGYIRNFERALQACPGDCMAMDDQGDSGRPRRSKHCWTNLQPRYHAMPRRSIPSPAQFLNAHAQTFLAPYPKPKAVIKNAVQGTLAATGFFLPLTLGITETGSLRHCGARESSRASLAASSQRLNGGLSSGRSMTAQTKKPVPAANSNLALD